MNLEDLTPAQIRKLNEKSKHLYGAHVRIPSFNEQKKAKTIIEEILPGDGEVRFSYVQNVLLALQYYNT